MKNKKRQSSSRPLLAFLLIVIGVGYLLKNLEIIPEFTVFFDGFWTLFIIIPAIINIISGKSRRAGFIWLFIGLALLSLCIDALRVVRPLLIPVFLILIGFMLFTKKGTFKYRRIYNKLSEDYARYPVYRAFFSRRSISSYDKSYIGAFASAFCSEMSLSFSEADFSHPSVLDITAILSTVDITVPVGTDVRITHGKNGRDSKSRSVSLNTAASYCGDDMPVLFLTPHSLFSRINVSFS